MKKITNLKEATVLLVDDDAFLRNMYAAKFRAVVGKVEVVGSAEEALERLGSGLTPDLIVFDVIMPGEGGYGLLKGIQKDHLAQGAAKIALTNQSNEAELMRVMDLGADGHLAKTGSTPSEIVEKILEMVS